MIDASTILTFDGTVITGLFIFYAFLVALAERFEKAKQRLDISTAIQYLAFVQLFFAVSAILVLLNFPNWAIGLSIMGLILLVVYFFLMMFRRGLLESDEK